MKIKNLKLKIRNYNAGMTLLELIVVLTIFSMMTSVIIFNYGGFQAKVDIKSLASDVALQIVQAQKSSLSGLLPPSASQYPTTVNWKPSYGVYFSTSSTKDSKGADNKDFIYFTDLDNTTPPQNGIFDGTDCTGECLNKITITKGDYINIPNIPNSGLNVFYQSGSPTALNNLTITFSRPSSFAILKSTPAFSPTLTVSYVQITISSPDGKSTAFIKLYPSGRIQVN